MGDREGFLIDTSAAARLITKPAALAAWGEALAAGKIGICAPTEGELLYSARSVAEMRAMRAQFERLYTWWVVPDDVWRQIPALQLRLAETGSHRSAGVVDLVVAVTAMHHGLTVLHYDRDFETIAKHTDLKARWLAEPGSLD
ncbi:PIN domain nuclease [Kitasatospora aureofaciens]|uniref:PIN domain nuclease n=1 Tax=Kitasatospora aureofaciens TaxID=1894 RepID=UPI001C4575D9|nr:PIN domain nuclease [Kitasatospora aureofaciens]MBV6703367.1 PIN domain nuclease [Kitasatospora aureofaciens]